MNEVPKVHITAANFSVMCTILIGVCCLEFVAVTVCPTFVQVIGCNIQSSEQSVMNQLHYPTVDGTGCQCNSYNNSARPTCIASCASNINRHEVRYQRGSGVIKVTCAPYNTVLGCSVKPEYDDLTSTVGDCSSWTIDEGGETCECYEHDERGATCYAICGQTV